MPFTVITLTRAAPNLRGDLTKWLQEIATGVYIGNINTKVREQLWARVLENIGNGEATISYGFRNELGYQFIVHNTKRNKIDFDGIPLVYIPSQRKTSYHSEKHGYSKAAQFQKAKQFSSTNFSVFKNVALVFLDIETSGLDARKDKIIEIGAVKVIRGKSTKFSKLIKINGMLKQEITELTGITNELLNNEGVSLENALLELKEFIQHIPIIGFSISFDMSFLNKAIQELNMESLNNHTYDLIPFIKKERMFLKNYKLETVLKEYAIESKVEHRAVSDAKLILMLASKVNGFVDFINKK